MNNDKFYEIHIEIENHCFLKCLHCSSSRICLWKNRGVDINNVVKFINLLDCKTHIYLTGGDPLLCTGLLSYIKEIATDTNNASIGLFTCGIRDGNLPIDAELAYQLKQSGIVDCYLSIYHINPKIHDYITNMPHSYEKTKLSIQNLIDAGIDVKINLVLNKYNYLELDEIIKRICGLGVKEIRLLRLVCGGRAKENWDDIGVTYRQQNEQIARILDKLDEYHFKITIAGFPEKYPCRPFDAARKCQAGLNILYITYQGNLFPCACVKNNQKHLIGHISNDKEIKTFLEKTRKIKCHNHCLNPVL